MAGSIQRQFADLCRSTRVGLDVTQAQLSKAVGVSRPVISATECGRADPTLGLVERISRALGLELELVARPPVAVGIRQRDLVHSRCSAYVHRRLEATGLICQREVEVAGGRSHGWIDILSFDPRTGVLYVIEVKTVIDDIGGAERQLAWYTRMARQLAAARGWHPRRIRGWLLVLATDEVDRLVRQNREVLTVAFPTRAVAMRRELAGIEDAGEGWGLALVDPASRRQAWLQPTRLEGRRTTAPYRDYADAASRWRDTPGTRRTRPTDRV